MSQETNINDDAEDVTNGKDKEGHPLDNLPVISTDKTVFIPSATGAGETDEGTKNAMESLLAHRKQRRRKRIVIGVVAVCVVAGLIAWNVISAQQAANMASEPTLQTSSVQHGEFVDKVKASGSVEPVNSVVVTPEVDGIISEVNVHEGDTVEKGQTLLVLRNDSLDKAVREADIQLRTAKTQLASAKDTYNTACKAYYAGEADLATANSAADAVDTAQLALESAQDAYDDAVATADKRTVTAPTSGSVVVMNAVEGAAFGSGTGAGASATAASSSSGSLITIGDLSQMTVTVQVNEMDIAKVAVGQAARVTFSALPGVELDATVTRIATVASSNGSSADAHGSGSVVTYAVDLLIPNPDPSLKPGMTASVAIAATDIPDTLMVPASAISGEGDSATVTVVTGYDERGMPQTEDRSVKVLATDGSTAAVEGNISEGEEVAIGMAQSADTHATDGSYAQSGMAV
ncbi:efflux RND transporter periplasmic adaptor subunit [Olsenella sp. Marseille-P4559]|uniref:efflux RND transporter periplasmic adaptor subunit n=1 Tax=Olsenella sp. Marseille-P4559 TaxID=2364795 RepID=UPI00102FDE10|nr:efflux RND transporter periplasmic adaptor subunit [Olsenella sp. Marseille-P4559]